LELGAGSGELGARSLEVGGGSLEEEKRMKRRF
jgi:hypothetical protein